MGESPVGLVALEYGPDPHPAQPACWSANRSQHLDFQGAGPPCLGGGPGDGAGNAEVVHANPPRLDPDPLVPQGAGNTAQMGGGKN